MNIGITGSRYYENQTFIKKVLWQLYQRYPAATFISCGETVGADKYVKKFSLAMGANYAEINPGHTAKNIYSLLPTYFYNKPFDVKHFYVRNTLFVKAIDYCIVFTSPDDKGHILPHLIKELKTKNKKCLFYQ